MSDLAERIQFSVSKANEQETRVRLLICAHLLIDNAPTILAGLAAIEALEKLKALPWFDENAKWTTSHTDTLHDCLGVPRIDWSTYKELKQ